MQRGETNLVYGIGLFLDVSLIRNFLINFKEVGLELEEHTGNSLHGWEERGGGCQRIVGKYFQRLDRQNILLQ